MRILGLLVATLIVASTGMSASPVVYDRAVYLPVIIGPITCPPVRVFDHYGTEQNWDWLQQTFGPVWIEQGDGSACLIELRDEIGPVSSTVLVLDAQGQPKGGVTVVLYYSTAPQLPPEFWGCYQQGDYGQTKSPPDPAAGTIGFWIGGGAYEPPSIGPYTIWVGTPGSDCIHGIGWLGWTNHRHLNPTFMLSGEE